MTDIKIFNFNLFRENCMVLSGKAGECVIIDPGCQHAKEKEELDSYLSGNSLKPVAILLTHAHLDHIFGVKDLQAQYGMPVYMNLKEQAILEFNKELSKRFCMDIPNGGFEISPANEGDVIEAAGIRFEVIGTPGHTPGGVCYLDREHKRLFSGDTLFYDTIGRTDLDFGSYEDLIKSIMDKLMTLDGNIEIFPGHGITSTIGRERTSNPMLEPWGEKEDMEFQN